MMHDRRPSELKTGAFLGLEGHFPVLGGHIPMKIPIGTEIPIGGSYPEIPQAGFRSCLALFPATAILKYRHIGNIE